MILSRFVAALTVVAFASPALAAPVLVSPSAKPAVLVQDKSEEHGKKNAKGKAKHEDKKNVDRTNKGGDTRGKDRADQVQGMQDTGKGSGKRP